MLNTAKKITAVLVIVCFFSGCAKRPGQEEFMQIITIPSSNIDERSAKFASYSVEKQIDIYLYATYGIEGGDTDFFGYLIVDGEKKIPYLVKRIDESDDPRTKTGLIQCLKYIDLDCKCISNDNNNLNILIRNEMPLDEKDSDGIRIFKELYSRNLQEIKVK